MKIITRLLFVLIIPMLLIAVSCKKDGGTIKAEGMVIDKTTSQPVPEAMVYLRHQRRDIATAGAMGISSIASQKADENGKFSFTFDASDDFIYEVLARKENYFDDGNNATSVPASGNSDLKVPLQPEAYLKIHVVNANPFDNNDMISMAPPFGYNIGPFYGKKIDRIFKDKTTGNTKSEVIYWVIKNGIETKNKDSIFCPAFDTTLYEIKY